jgi:hypothetical protein
MVLKEEQPLTPDYITATPDYAAPTQKPNLATKIVGMGLSIEGFTLAVLAAIYTFVFLIAAVASGEPEMGIMSLVFTFWFALFGLPGSIVGLSFSNKARNLGDTSAFSRVGKALGLVGIIIFGACFVIALFATVAGV